MSVVLFRNSFQQVKVKLACLLVLHACFCNCEADSGLRTALAFFSHSKLNTTTFTLLRRKSWLFYSLNVKSTGSIQFKLATYKSLFFDWSSKAQSDKDYLTALPEVA